MALKRRLLILGGVLALGAAVNVAVAWACATWHYVGRAPRIAIGSTLGDGAIPCQAAMYRSGMAHRVHSIWGPLVTTQEARGWPRELGGRWARLLLPESEEDQQAGARVLDRRGWPMRSMWSALEIDAAPPRAPGIGPTVLPSVTCVIRGIELSPYPQFGSEAMLHQFRVLPLGIIWLGYAGNTVLFAAMAWALLASVHYSRRAIRAGAGRCPGCAYEIRSTACDRCPECGGAFRLARIGTPAARRLRRGVLLGWCELLLAATVLAGGRVWPWVSGYNWDAYKPWWWLRATAKGLDETRSRAALDELITRIKDEKLAADVVGSLVQSTLAIQADFEHPWLPQWGDVVAAARSKNLVSDDAWRTFARQAVVPQLVIRPEIVQGDVVAAKFLLHKRAPSEEVLVVRVRHLESRLGDQTYDLRSNTRSQLNLDCRSGAPSHSRFIEFDFSGRGRVAHAGSHGVADVEPGSYIFETSWQVEISEGTIGMNGVTTGETLCSETFETEAAVTVLPRGSETVEVVSDESLRAAVEASLHLYRVDAAPGPRSAGAGVDSSSRTTTTAHGTVFMEVIPIDLAFDVLLRAGDREWPIGQIDSDMMHSRSYPTFLGSADGLEGARVDVVLRPSRAAARRTTSITRIWGGEIVIEDVALEWKEDRMQTNAAAPPRRSSIEWR